MKILSLLVASFLLFSTQSLAEGSYSLPSTKLLLKKIAQTKVKKKNETEQSKNEHSKVDQIKKKQVIEKINKFHNMEIK